MPENIQEICAELRTRMDSTHKAREEALAAGRKIIQSSSKAIKCIHRKQFDDAQANLSDVDAILAELADAVKNQPQLKHAPSVQDSVKESVEAKCLFALVQQRQLPSASDLNVEPSTYLNGLCEAASELRRFALDSMRSGETELAYSLCDEMEDIYDELITFDYPDAVTSNLRRNVDSLRAVLERTRSDLAVTGTQLELIEELRKTNDAKS
ncbi:MAG: hypothetical protein U0R49_03035 [Fimbriimonadales bacterium]